FVPVMSAWLTKRPLAGHHVPGAGLLAQVVEPAVWLTTRARWLLAPLCLVSAGLLLFVLYRGLGQGIFPQVDSGQFQFRLKAPTGTRIEQTEEIVKEALRVIKEEAGEE